MPLHWKNAQGPCPAASLTNERQEINWTECTGLVSGHSLGGVHSPKQRLPLLGTRQSEGHHQLLPETDGGSFPEPEQRLERRLYGSSSQHCQMKQILPALQRTRRRKSLGARGASGASEHLRPLASSACEGTTEGTLFCLVTQPPAPGQSKPACSSRRSQRPLAGPCEFIISLVGRVLLQKQLPGELLPGPHPRPRGHCARVI